MTGTPFVLLAATLAIALLLAPALALFFGGLPTRTTALTLVFAFLGAMLLAAVEWLLLGVDADVAIFQGALAATAVTVVLSIGLRRGQRRGYLVFCAAWVVTVLVPVGYSLFDVVRGPLAVSLGTLDFGGVSILALCTGTAAAAIVMVSRSLGNAVGGLPPRTLPVFLFCAIAGPIGWLAASGGSELVIDSTTLTLASNEVWAAVAGSIGWTIAQVLNVRRATVAGFVAGGFAGSIVVLAASPWFNTVSVVVLGLGAGILGEVSAVGARRTGSGRWATLVGVCLVPGALGMVATGIVASGPGLVFSGHIELLASQFSGLVLILGYSTVVALLLAIVIDRTLRLTGSSRFVDETVLRLYRSLAAGDTVGASGVLHPQMEWPTGWDATRVVEEPVSTRRLRGGWIAVRFAEPGLVHTFHERDGVFDRMEFG